MEDNAKQKKSSIFHRLRSPFTKAKKEGDKDSLPTPPSILTEQTELDKRLVFSLAKKRLPSWQQLQYLPQYLSKKEKIILWALVGCTIVSLGFLLVRFYQRHIVYLPKEGGSYTEALIGQPNYINPVLAQSDIDRDISKLIYSGLFTYNEDLELVPDLATGYELSEDKKVYTIHLRPDCKWQNGNALLADDIVFTFATIKDSEYNSPYYSSFQGVTIERIDDYTVTFSLQEPFSPFLSNLTIGILPAHIWSDVSPSNFKLAEYNTKPIGSGAYQFEELTKDRTGTIKSYLLTPNPYYYQTKPYLQEINFRFYADFESATSALKNNTVDGISYLPNDYQETAKKNDQLVIYPLQLPQYTAIFFNNKNDLLKDQAIRQALAYATDKKRIVTESLNNEGVSIDGPILEGFLGHHPDIKKYEYNIEQAKTTLDEAGWTVPEDGGLRQKDGNELKFSLTTVDQSDYLKTADILRTNWEAINVGIELKIMNPLRVDREVIKPRNYEAFLYGEILGSDPDPYPFWHSSQSLSGGLNLSNYYNKDVDKLLEEARTIDNPDERAKKYIDFQNIIAEEAPAIFLYSPYYDYGVVEKVKGIEISRITIPSDRLNGVASWYIKTRLGWE